MTQKRDFESYRHRILGIFVYDMKYSLVAFSIANTWVPIHESLRKILD